MSIFQNKIGATDITPLDQMLSGVRSELDTSARASGFNASDLTRYALSVESLDKNSSETLRTAVEGMSNALSRIHTNVFGVTKEGSYVLTQAQKDAGIVASMMVGDIGRSMKAPVRHAIASTENFKVMDDIGLPDAFDARTYIKANEAYDERANAKAQQYTVVYNTQAARQNAFGEAFYPTVTIASDSIGYSVQARIMSVFNDFHRNVSGDLDPYNKTNIIRATIDATILQDNLTDIVPVVVPTSAKYFVAPAVIAPTPVTIGTDTFNTAPMAFTSGGKGYSLIGLSQVPSLLANGSMDPSDSVDRAIALKKLYISVGADVFSFPTLDLPLSAFAAAVQGNYRQMNVAFRTDSLMINSTTLTVANAAPAVMTTPASANLLVRLHAEVYGSVNIETGETSMTASNLSVVSVQDANGVMLSLTAGAGLVIVNQIATATYAGYDLQAYRTNVNRRQRGQLIDTTFYTQLYPVPLRGPITSLRPVTSDGQTDSADLAALITTTQIRCSNDAVTSLLGASATMAAYLDSRTSQTIGVTPDILGVSRLLVSPTYTSVTIDMTAAVASLTATQRIADIQATLSNVCRDVAIRLYRDSGYQPAADAMAGGVAPPPTVILGTDPVIANYLMTSGDLRTLGNGLPVKVVSTYDSRMSGTIMIAFGQFDHANENAPNPMHFGNMAWQPEISLVLPIPRGGQVSKELTVQPRYRHIVNMPVLAQITVNNLPDVVAGRLPVAWQADPAAFGTGVVRTTI